MSIRKAIKHARSRVTLSSFGNQYVVYHWSEYHNAMWQSNPTDYWKARAHAREAMIGEALEFLGIPEPDAEANILSWQEGRWTDLVREHYRRTRL